MTSESKIVVDLRLQTAERQLPQGEAHGVLTGTGPLPERALEALEASARDRAIEIAARWDALPPRMGAAGTVTADFILSGVRLVAGQVSILDRGVEIEVGWLAYGTLTAASGHLRWDDELR